MDNLHNDERISAYLDGELSADEQVRFEERLAESAELRQLVEELRALRGSLDLLPRHRLEPDFADHVLRRAEREMLTAGDGASSSGPTEGVGHAVRAAVSPEHAARPATGESRNWKRRALRPLIYSAIAIAAAVLIMVFNPPRDKDVAQVGDNAKPTRLPEGAVVSSNGSGNGTVAGAAGEANRPTADSRKELESLADRKDSPAARGGRADFSDDSHRRSGGQAELAKQGGTPAGAPAGNFKDGDVASKASNLAQSLGRSKQGQAKGQLSEEQDAAKAKTPAGAMPNQVARDRAGQGINLRLKIEAGGVEKTPSSDRKFDFAETTVPASSANGPVETGKGQANGIPSGGFAADGRDPATEVLRRSDIASTGMVVANCIASPEAADHAFLGLLAKNHIAMGTPSDGALTTYSAPLDRLAKKPAEPADNDQLVRSGGQAAEAKRSLGEIEKAKDKPGDVEVIYVEGTAEQITALVYDLKDQPRVFRSLTVTPAPTDVFASYAYQGGFAKDNRPVEPQFGGLAGGKRAAQNAEPNESLREREAHAATPKSETLSSSPAKARAGNEPSDHLPSDQISVEGLGAKLSRSDKTMKDQKQMEPAGGALADNQSALAGKPMKPAENGAPNGVSAQFQSRVPQHPVGEKTPLPLGTTSRTPTDPAATPSVPASPMLDAASTSQPPAAPAARAAAGAGTSRPLSHAEADKKSIDWGDKQVTAPIEAADAKREPSARRGYAVRLDSWALDTPPVQFESPKTGVQKADDAPANAPAPPVAAGSVTAGVSPLATDRSAAKKDEGKSSGTKLSLPSIQDRGDRTSPQSGPKSSPKDAIDGLQAAPARMQAIFIFRLAPAPAAAAAAAPPAQPPAARPPAAGGAAPTAKEKK